MNYYKQNEQRRVIFRAMEAQGITPDRIEWINARDPKNASVVSHWRVEGRLPLQPTAYLYEGGSITGPSIARYYCEARNVTILLQRIAQMEGES